MEVGDELAEITLANNNFAVSATETQLEADTNLPMVGASATAATVKAAAVAHTLTDRLNAAKKIPCSSCCRKCS